MTMHGIRSRGGRRTVVEKRHPVDKASTWLMACKANGNGVSARKAAFSGSFDFAFGKCFRRVNKRRSWTITPALAVSDVGSWFERVELN
jgi:hypothetical protein